MATYKVLQDIEAEDKLVGALTLRQFIYAGIAALCGYLSFIVATKGAPFLLVVFLPVMLVMGFFAFPWGRDQPTEVWALAKIRFLVKPRRRIWDQSGVKDLVTITVPKKVEHIYTNGLSQTEVHSRLTALASTIDSRGWATKNVNVNLYSQPSQLSINGASDRLVDPANLPQEVPTIDVRASDDMLDAQNNPLAQQFDSMIATSTQNHRQQLIQQMSQPTVPVQPSQGAVPPADYWFLNQPAGYTPGAAKPQVVLPGMPTSFSVRTAPTADEQELLEEIKQHKAEIVEVQNSHLQVVQPLSAQSQHSPTSTALPPAPPQPAQATRKAPEDAILNLANNNDLNVATIAREAKKAEQQALDDTEVVISLH